MLLNKKNIRRTYIVETYDGRRSVITEFLETRKQLPMVHRSTFGICAHFVITASQTHFGFAKMGSEMHSFRGTLDFWYLCQKSTRVEISFFARVYLSKEFLIRT